MEHDPLLVLSIARMRFLHTPEKLLLYDVAGSIDGLSSLSREDLSRIIGRTLKTGRWETDVFQDEAGNDLHRVSRRELSYVFYWDEEYPPVLREIFDPPFVLFFRGNLPESGRPAAGVVGTRNPTGKAVNAAYELGFEFALNGVPVISGLARGIDKAAHSGAVKAGGRTFAVLGCGIETVYPRENRRLAENILNAGGGLLSEYPPGSPALRYHFPERNRIISGLSRSVIIVEAPPRSGALITSAFALEQGRDVYVHAAGNGSPELSGAGRLAQDGAPVISGVPDVLADWGMRPEAVRRKERVREDSVSRMSVASALAGSLARELEGVSGRTRREFGR